MSQPADLISLGQEARAHFEERLRQNAADQEQRNRQRRDYLITSAFEDLERVNLAVSKDDVHVIDDPERLVLTYDGLLFHYEGSGASSRQWWLMSTCPNCDEDIAYPVSMHTRDRFLATVGEALCGPPDPYLHTCRSDDPTQDPEEDPGIDAVPATYSIHERALLDALRSFVYSIHANAPHDSQ